MTLGEPDRAKLIETAKIHMAAYQTRTGSRVIDGPISWLQRHLRIGYLSAVVLAVRLELLGVWSPHATMPASRVVARLR